MILNKLSVSIRPLKTVKQELVGKICEVTRTDTNVEEHAPKILPEVHPKRKLCYKSGAILKAAPIFIFNLLQTLLLKQILNSWE